jgi:hypothetical protein
MATQKGRNWSSGDIVTAANLSSIERGVSAVAEEYTPTTWANGNTVTAAGLNNIEQGIVNAGGSSDLSTATLTLVDNIGDGVDLGMPYITEANAWYEGQPAGIYCSFQTYESGNYTVPLYKGSLVIEVVYQITTSGDIANMVDNIYIITGDCTITISDSSGGTIEV